jgi:hypothetical protein
MASSAVVESAAGHTPVPSSASIPALATVPTEGPRAPRGCQPTATAHSALSRHFGRAARIVGDAAAIDVSDQGAARHGQGHAQGDEDEVIARDAH